MTPDKEDIQNNKSPSYNVYVSGWGPNPKPFDNNLATSISTISIKSRLQVRWRSASNSNGSDMIRCNRQDDILCCENKRQSCRFL